MSGQIIKAYVKNIKFYKKQPGIYNSSSRQKEYRTYTQNINQIPGYNDFEFPKETSAEKPAAGIRHIKYSNIHQDTNNKQYAVIFIINVIQYHPKTCKQC